MITNIKKIAICLLAAFTLSATMPMTIEAKGKTKTSQTAKQSGSKKKSGSKGKSKNSGNKSAQPTDSKSIRQQKEKNARQIRETDAQIKENNRKVAASLNDLNRIKADISDCNTAISHLSTRLDSISAKTAVINDSIGKLDARLQRLRSTFATALRNSRRARSSMNNLTFIFSSQSFTQAYRRMRALQQFDKWRSRKSGEIVDVMDRLKAQRQQLDSLHNLSQKTMNQLSAGRSQLQTKQKENDRIVADLKTKGEQLQRVLRQQHDEASRLDRELDRIIAQEQKAAEERRRKEEAEARRREQERQARIERERIEKERAAKEQAEKERLAKEKDEQEKAAEKASEKQAEKPKESKKDNKKETPKPKAETPTPKAETKPAETKQDNRDMAANAPAKPAAELGANFGDNKGKLPFPVDGQYKIVKHFGRQHHPDFPNIETDNSGIDIQTASGANVKAVFEGQVSAIFCPDGYNNVVVIRHGSYVTVYANLGSLNVRTGQKVTRGQSLGKVHVDTADGNRSILHFEIRNATNANNIRKENPESWLR